MQNLTSEQIKLLSNIHDMLISNDKEAISLGKDILLNEPLLSNLNILLYYVKCSMESDDWFSSAM